MSTEFQRPAGESVGLFWVAGFAGFPILRYQSVAAMPKHKWDAKEKVWGNKMEHEQVARLITATVSSNDGVSIKLPSGWIGGRIGDALFHMTWVAARRHWLLVGFSETDISADGERQVDERILLVFTDVGTVVASPRDITFKDFGQLVFHLKGRATGEPRTELFEEGEVILAAGAAFSSSR
jgi:hypothetical protein